MQLLRGSFNAEYARESSIFRLSCCTLGLDTHLYIELSVLQAGTCMIYDSTVIRFWIASLPNETDAFVLEAARYFAMSSVLLHSLEYTVPQWPKVIDKYGSRNMPAGSCSS